MKADHVYQSTTAQLVIVAFTVIAILLTVVATGMFAPSGGRASSHREAPLISQDPTADNTDTYVFMSPDKPDTVTMVASWIPLQEPAGGPNFYPFAENTFYDINIDNNGDARPDIRYRWQFQNSYLNTNTFLYNTGVVTSLDDPDLNFRQTYTLTRIEGRGRNAQKTTLASGAPVVPSNVGAGSMPNYEALFQQGIVDLGNNSNSWGGQSDDPFFLDLRVFDLLYGGNLSEVGDDTLAGFNVNTLALQVPLNEVARNGNASQNPIIGVFSTTSRRTTRVLPPRTGGVRGQVSRLGMPLVNEVIIPLSHKDLFNASQPRADAQFASFYNDPEVARLLNAVYGLSVPPTPRTDIFAIFNKGIPGLNQPPGVVPGEMIRLHMGTPVCEPSVCSRYSRLGLLGGDIAGFPNGRRLGDDVVDISLQALAGETFDPSFANDLGDGVDTNDVPFRSTFPYVALPKAGSDPDPHTP